MNCSSNTRTFEIIISTKNNDQQMHISKDNIPTIEACMRFVTKIVKTLNLEEFETQIIKH